MFISSGHGCLCKHFVDQSNKTRELTDSAIMIVRIIFREQRERLYKGIHLFTLLQMYQFSMVSQMGDSKCIVRM